MTFPTEAQRLGNDARYGEAANAYRSEASERVSPRAPERLVPLDSVESAPPTIRDARCDAVATAALAVVRRALIEGVPVTRERLAQEASFALGGSSEDALRDSACRTSSGSHRVSSPRRSTVTPAAAARLRLLHKSR
jgi:hypothetical protein